MSLEFLIWFACFVLQFTLLGRTMFVMTSFADLETDRINPYDFAARFNRFLVAENACQVAIALLLCLSGKFFAGALHVAGAIYLARLFLRGEQAVDAADVFKTPALKRQRIIMFVFYLVTTILVMYRLIESAIHSLLTPHGRQIAKRLFQEAGASLHH